MVLLSTLFCLQRIFFSQSRQTWGWVGQKAFFAWKECLPFHFPTTLAHFLKVICVAQPFFFFFPVFDSGFRVWLLLICYLKTRSLEHTTFQHCSTRAAELMRGLKYVTITCNTCMVQIKQLLMELLTVKNNDQASIRDPCSDSKRWMTVGIH